VEVSIKIFYEILQDSLSTMILLQEVPIHQRVTQPFIIRIIIDIMDPIERGTFGSLTIVFDKMKLDLHHFLSHQEGEEENCNSNSTSSNDDDHDDE
jgi:hypothetical protein